MMRKIRIGPMNGEMEKIRIQPNKGDMLKEDENMTQQGRNREGK